MFKDSISHFSAFLLKMATRAIVGGGVSGDSAPLVKIISSDAFVFAGKVYSRSGSSSVGTQYAPPAVFPFISWCDWTEGRRENGS